MIDDDSMPEVETTGPAEARAWLTEHERALDRLRVRVTELETVVDTERDLTVLHAAAAAGIFALLLALSLPWLAYGDDSAASGWSLLLAPLAAPLTAGAAYLVVAATIVHGTALLGRGRCCALMSAIIAALAGLGTIGLIFTVASDPDVEAGPGPGVTLIIVIILGIIWGSIADTRRWGD